ncbi:MAG: transcriptional regulator [Bowdeniella nasicola]|nr:transcriptional regulator [Bowdeniella nasicola]
MRGVERYLTRTDIAARLGLKPSTIASYAKKGMLPPPDALVGLGQRGTYGWLPETVDAWQAARPRAGRRHRAARESR